MNRRDCMLTIRGCYRFGRRRVWPQKLTCRRILPAYADIGNMVPKKMTEKTMAAHVSTEWELSKSRSKSERSTKPNPDQPIKIKGFTRGSKTRDRPVEWERKEGGDVMVMSGD